MESRLVNLPDNTFMRNCPTSERASVSGSSQSFIFIYVFVRRTRETEVTQGASRTSTHTHARAHSRSLINTSFVLGIHEWKTWWLRWICAQRSTILAKRLPKVWHRTAAMTTAAPDRYCNSSKNGQNLNTAECDARKFAAQETQDSEHKCQTIF